MEEQPTREAESSSRTALLVAQLRHSIEQGLLLPGQRLVEADLRKEYGVSRGPVREAFARLSAEGLVDLIPNKGAVVRRMGRRDLANIMAIREALEGLAAGLAARNIDIGDHRSRLEAFSREGRLGEQKSAEDFLVENETVHTMLVSFADNPQLSDLIDRMRLQAFPRRMSSSLNNEEYRLASSREHRSIVHAVLSGDEFSARQAMQKHLANASERLLKAMVEDAPIPIDKQA